MKERSLEKIREAVGFLEAKATPEELGDYRGFVISLAERVAGAKGEVSEPETAAITEIRQALGS